MYGIITSNQRAKLASFRANSAKKEKREDERNKTSGQVCLIKSRYVSKDKRTKSSRTEHVIGSSYEISPANFV